MFEAFLYRGGFVWWGGGGGGGGGGHTLLELLKSIIMHLQFRAVNQDKNTSSNLSIVHEYVLRKVEEMGIQTVTERERVEKKIFLLVPFHRIL